MSVYLIGKVEFWGSYFNHFQNSFVGCLLPYHHSTYKQKVCLSY